MEEQTPGHWGWGVFTQGFIYPKLEWGGWGGGNGNTLCEKAKTSGTKIKANTESVLEQRAKNTT